jgi:hypothetical protein
MPRLFIECGVEAEGRIESRPNTAFCPCSLVGGYRPGRCYFYCDKLSIWPALNGSAQLREPAIPAACAACLLLN